MSENTLAQRARDARRRTREREHRENRERRERERREREEPPPETVAQQAARLGKPYTTVYEFGNKKRDFLELKWSTLVEEYKYELTHWGLVDRSTGKKLYPPPGLISLPHVRYTAEYFEFVGEDNPRSEEKDSIMKRELEFIPFFMVRDVLITPEQVYRDILYYTAGKVSDYSIRELESLTGYDTTTLADALYRKKNEDILKEMEKWKKEGTDIASLQKVFQLEFRREEEATLEQSAEFLRVKREDEELDRRGDRVKDGWDDEQEEKGH